MSKQSDVNYKYENDIYHIQGQTMKLNRFSNSAIFGIISLLMISCQALSPSIQAPSKPIEKNTFAFQASLETMPEVNKSAFNKNFSGGECLMLRYGLTETVTMQAKAWIPNNNYEEDTRWGFALMPTIYLNDVKDDYNFFITPTMNFLQSGSSFDYASLGMYAGVIFPKVWILHSYSSLSLHSSWDWNSNFNSFLTATANIGIRIPISRVFDINFEVMGTLLNLTNNNYHWSNSRAEGSRFLVAPLLGVGVKL